MRFIGRVLVSLFLGALLLLGTAFTAMIIKDSAPAIRALYWQKTPCRVTFSSITPDPKGYRLLVEYTYRCGSKEYRSREYPYHPTFDYQKLKKFRERCESGAVSTCFINPGSPADSRLRRSFPFQIFYVLIPLFFAVLGAKGLLSSWGWGKRSGPKALSDLDSSFSRKGASRPAWNATGHSLSSLSSLKLALYLVLFAGGVTALWYAYTKPFFEIMDAWRWEKVPCTILESEVVAHEDSEGSTTYSLEMLYCYRYRGMEYLSKRVALEGAGPRKYRGKRAFIEAHPMGSEATCHVNPAKPWQAALLTDGSPLWLLSLVIAAFCGGMIFALTNELKNRARIYHLMDERPSPRALLTGTSFPAIQIAGWALLCLLWNYPLAWFLFQAFFKAATLRTVEFPSLFFTFFYHFATGIFIAALGFRAFAALRAPHVTLEIAPYPFHPGKPAMVKWRTCGATEKIGKLSLFIEGREEADYVQGTTSLTDRETFRTFFLAGIDKREDFAGGEVVHTFPHLSMHTFRSDHNRVRWILKAEAEGAEKPLFTEEFEILVLPEKGAVSRKC
ncbi:MAG: DUF3592 domain-containing protein [Candidatus Eremiobacteraeota bacterium]|nr:DUF3592 domain-containing protein [Candidatus Eremiobacteraeota bacterium]